MSALAPAYRPRRPTETVLHSLVREHLATFLAHTRETYAVPPLSLERLRRLPGGRVAYRLKYVDRGRRGKHRVMTGIEFMARLAAIIAPREVVPKPREQRTSCETARTERPARAERRLERKAGDALGRPEPRARAPSEASSTDRRPAVSANDVVTALRCSAHCLSPATLSGSHRTSSRSGTGITRHRPEWIGQSFCLRRSFSVDVLECPKCHGRLRMVAVITERAPARRILAHLVLPTDPLPVARARDPTDDADEAGDDGQLALGLA